MKFVSHFWSKPKKNWGKKHDKISKWKLWSMDGENKILASIMCYYRRPGIQKTSWIENKQGRRSNGCEKYVVNVIFLFNGSISIMLRQFWWILTSLVGKPKVVFYFCSFVSVVVEEKKWNWTILMAYSNGWEICSLCEKYMVWIQVKVWI